MAYYLKVVLLVMDKIVTFSSLFFIFFIVNLVFLQEEYFIDIECYQFHELFVF